jgi:hypothetical protein
LEKLDENEKKKINFKNLEEQMKELEKNIKSIDIIINLYENHIKNGTFLNEKNILLTKK